MRLIDADALKKAMDGYWGRCQRIRKPRNGETAVFLDVMATVENQPTVDAVPSEMLYDFIREIGTITYGKERFFYEDDLWYDRKSCDYITTQKAIEECLKAVRELDDLT